MNVTVADREKIAANLKLQNSRNFFDFPTMSSGTIDDNKSEENDTHCDDFRMAEFNIMYQHKCSPWQYCKNGSCHCGPKFHITLYSASATKTSNCYCVTFNKKKGLTEVVYNCGTNVNGRQYFPLPNDLAELNSQVCGQNFNRTGTLCSECVEDHYPRVHSFDIDCIRCSNGRSNFWKFLLVAFLPLTFFCLFILLFKINVTSSHLHGFVIFCEAVYTPALMRIYLCITSNSPSIQRALRGAGVLFGKWNLDFFRSLQLGRLIPYRQWPLT